MPITAPPTAPSTLDPENFALEMDDFLAWMKTFGDALISEASLFLSSTSSTSTTSLLVGLGTKNLTVQTGKGYQPGMEVIIAYSALSTTRMVGTVLSYDSVTGALSVSVTSIGGSGTQASWVVSPTVAAGFNGQTFTNLILAGALTETPYPLAGTDINPANGTVQYCTLSANRTFTSSIAVGQAVLLVLTKGAWTAGWPTMDWLYGDPTLSSTYPSWIVLANVTGTLVGLYAGPAI